MDSSCRENVREMFTYHEVDGALDKRGFSQLLQEGLACSFLDAQPTPAIRGDLRCACLRQQLPGVGSPLFERLFGLFDYEQQGKLSEEQLISGLDQFFFGSFEQMLEGLFHLTDLNSDGLLNSIEMEEFLQDFRVLFYSMALAVFELRRQKLICSSDASQRRELEARAEHAREMLNTDTTIVSTECAKMLDELDTNHDRSVDLLSLIHISEPTRPY
eukprot:TRINITY_DN39227_c0_g1_i2.p1 TRINITY_DN39227_c0_g1~~TRINITY_DN39227_c0_g1_i2.p1  ORF type:complete len:216 (+),score=46.59 TRINITY_DN39227_c0_g1_i2:176-823(+)